MWCVCVAHTVRMRSVYLADFIDLPTCWTIKFMRFQAVKGLPLHILHCVRLQLHPCLFHGFLQASLSPTSDQRVIGCPPPPSVGSTGASSNQGTKE